MKARDNPFATNRLHQVRYRLEERSWEELLERLARMSYRAALVGPDGSGKTTLLEHLEPILRERGFTIKNLWLTEETPTFPRGFLPRFFADLTPHDLILFDGADLMSRLTWRWFKWQTRRAGGLVITSHRAGMLPTLIECRTSAELLDDIVTELLGEEAAALRQLTQHLYVKHRGNLRDALRELYDIYAARAEPPGVVHDIIY